MTPTELLAAAEHELQPLDARFLECYARHVAALAGPCLTHPDGPTANGVYIWDVDPVWQPGTGLKVITYDPAQSLVTLYLYGWNEQYQPTVELYLHPALAVAGSGQRHDLRHWLNLFLLLRLDAGTPGTHYALHRRPGIGVPAHR